VDMWKNVFTVSQPGLRAKMDWSLNRRIVERGQTWTS